MSAATVAAVGALMDDHPDLLPILEEHLVDNNGEVLPHLLLADVVRWMVDHHDSRPDLCRSIVGWMEAEYLRGTVDVRGLIRLSGVEMIPDPGQRGAEIRDLLGPVLRRVDPWSE